MVTLSSINDYSSDTSEIIESSQNISENIRNRPNTNSPKSTIKLNANLEDSNFKSMDKIDRKCSLSDSVYTSEKEEMKEMLNNMNDFESIDMTHDLTGLIIDEKLLNLEDPLNISHSTNIELTDQQNSVKEEIQDPLYIDEKDKIEFNGSYSFRIRKKQLPYFSARMRRLQSVKKNQLVPQQNKSCLSDKLLEKLRSLEIILQHDVPPQHNISILASLRKKRIAEKCQKYAPLKRGSYLEREDIIIKKNWITFCNIHNWDKNIVGPFICMRQNGKFLIPSATERTKFVQFLADGLPLRSLDSVYKRFKTLHIHANKGAYTPEENKIICSYMTKDSNKTIKIKCVELAKILNRTRQSISAHYQKLKLKNDEKKSETKGSDSDNTANDSDSVEEKNKNNCGTNLWKTVEQSTSSKRIIDQKVYSSIKWTSPIVKQFINILIEVTKCKNVNDLKNKDINQVVWKKMETTIGIDKTILEKFWYLQLHMQLFCPTPLYLNDLKICLIEYAYEHHLERLDDIEWEVVCLKFNGVTKLFLAQLLHSLIQYAKIKTKLHELKDNVEYLYKHHIFELEERTIDILLPKLNYESGRITCLDKGIERKIPDRFIIDPLNNHDDF